MSTVTSNTSPTQLVTRVHGTVTRARVTASGRVELTILDPAGGRWHLVSWEATCSTPGPDGPSGKSIVRTELDAESGLLTLAFSNDSDLTLTPNQEVNDESVEDWQLVTPEGLVLAYGPKGQWHLGETDGVDEKSPRPSAPEVTVIRNSRQWKQACREIGLDDQERELASKDLHAWRLAMGDD